MDIQVVKDLSLDNMVKLRKGQTYNNIEGIWECKEFFIMDNDTLIGRISNWLLLNPSDQEVLLYGLTLVKSFFLGYAFLLLVSLFLAFGPFPYCCSYCFGFQGIFGRAHVSSLFAAR